MAVTAVATVNIGKKQRVFCVKAGKSNRELGLKLYSCYTGRDLNCERLAYDWVELDTNMEAAHFIFCTFCS
jgi:hypothetical protein